MLSNSDKPVMPGLTRHPVNNCFDWIPAFAGMTNVGISRDILLNNQF